MRSRSGLNVMAALTLVCALALSACNPFRRKKATPVSPPAPTVQQPAPAPKKQEPAPEPVAPPPAPATTPKEPPDTRTVRLPHPTVKPAPQQKPQQPQPPPAEEKPQSPPAAPPGPQLGQILSAEEQQQYTRRTEEALGRARNSLRGLEGRRLNAEQRAAHERILTFMSQVEELRRQDLVQAARLAERAAVLAADLAASVR